MRPLPALIAATVAAAMLASGCREADRTPVPRPQAWPRIELYPAAYRTVAYDGLSMCLNDSAHFVPMEREGWFDVTYPAYAVKVNCSLTHVESSLHLADVLANRRERMGRNVEGAPHHASSFATEGGFGAMLITSRQSAVTPVQFLVTDSSSFVLTGVAVFDRPGTSADSIAPVVKAVEADVLALIESLRYE